MTHKIRTEDFNLLKTVLLLQELIYTLDDVNDLDGVKEKTTEYLAYLESNLEPILNNTYKSNTELYSQLTNDIHKSIDYQMKKKFDIISSKKTSKLLIISE